jgi:hypothetical protein
VYRVLDWLRKSQRQPMWRKYTYDALVQLLMRQVRDIVDQRVAEDVSLNKAVLDEYEQAVERAFDLRPSQCMPLHKQVASHVTKLLSEPSTKRILDTPIQGDNFENNNTQTFQTRVFW